MIGKSTEDGARLCLFCFLRVCVRLVVGLFCFSATRPARHWKFYLFITSVFRSNADDGSPRSKKRRKMSHGKEQVCMVLCFFAAKFLLE